MRCGNLILCLLLCVASVSSSSAQPPAGTLAGDISVSDEGIANYTIPLSLPPGTSGMTPDLSLVYNSSVSEGPLGVGWTLTGLPAITRCPAIYSRDNFHDIVDRDGNDRFCLDGQRLMVSAGSYGADGSQYRLENDNFSLFTAIGRSGDAPNYFNMQTKDGRSVIFGMNDGKRLAPGSSDPLTWYAERVIDSSGNYYQIQYQATPQVGELVPVRINYNANPGNGRQPSKSVRFTWGSGIAPHNSRFIAGVQVTNGALLTNIAMYVGESKVRDYTLTYTALDSPARAHLTKVQECGATESECLPPTTFSWGPVPSSFSYQSFPTLYALSPPQGYRTLAEHPIVTADWNGDGRTDIGRWMYETLNMYIATPTGFQFYQAVGFTNQVGNDFDYYPFIIGDFNGDGRSDVARVGRWDVLRTYLSNPSNQYYTQGQDITLFGGGSPSQIKKTLIAADFSGDGLTDFMQTDVNSRYATGVQIYYSFGNRFEPGSPVNLNSGGAHTKDRPFVTGDWNGDGMMDIGKLDSNSQEFLYAVGNGNFAPYANTYWNFANYLISDTIVSPVMVGDWNNDGYSDIARVGREGLYIFHSTGHGFTSSPQLVQAYGFQQGFSDNERYPIFSGDFNRDGAPDIGRVAAGLVSFLTLRNGEPRVNTELYDLAVSQGYSSQNQMPFIWGDWNGDGFTDVGRVGTSNIKLYTHSYHEAMAIASIKNGIGAETKIEYGLLTDSEVYSRENTAVQGPIRVVKRLQISNGLGGFRSNKIRYVSLRGDGTGRGQPAFDQKIVTDEQTGIVTTTFYKKDAPYQGMPYQVERKLANGTVISRQTDTLQNVKHSFNSYFIYVSSRSEESFELNGTPVDKKITSWTYDAYGSPTKIEVTHLDGHKETTMHEYRHTPSTWNIGLLLRSTVTNQAPGQAASSRSVSFEYNDRNLLTKELIEAQNSPGSLVTEYSYDVLGNIVSKTISGPDVPARTDTAVYDSHGVFATEVRNALGQLTQRQFDLRHGTITSQTDPNGVIATSEYDAFGRILKVTQPDGTTRTTTYEKFTGSDPANARYLIREVASDGRTLIVYHDELGRVIRRESLGFAGQRVLVDNVHNERGEETHSSLPYFAGETPLWSVTEYDAIGRPVVVTLPGNRVTRAQYSGLKQTTTDPLGKVEERTVDNLGQLKLLTDASGTVTYTYDNFGNLVLLKDQLGNETQITYNARGFKTSMQDPDTGLTQYQVNGLGQVLEERRADNSTIRQTYDLLGRITSRITADGTETWTFDQGASAIGKLSSVAGLNGYKDSYTYDELGRPIMSLKVIGGRSFKLRTTYDQLGRVQKLVYPSGFSIAYEYNQYGHLESVNDVEKNLSLWAAQNVDAQGRVLQERLGNNVSTEKMYDPETGALTRTTAEQLLDMTFAYDAVGNLTRRQDNLNGIAENFGYDNMYRLASSEVEGHTPVFVTYNAIGNITAKSDTGEYSYGGAGVHAVTAIRGAKPNDFRYDALGRRIQSDGQSLGYTPAGRVARITTTNNQTTFTYSPDDKRIEQKIWTKGSNGQFSTLSEHKRYVDDIYEEVTTGKLISTVHYLRAGKSVFAVHKIENTKSTSTSYLHKDHQGSIQAISSSKGVLLERLNFDAWGLKRNTDWSPASEPLYSSVDRSYTGHEYLDESSLIHMNGRVYDPVVGRFTSADPFIQAPDNSQSLNRYSYVLNNPLSYTDPSGFFFKKLFKTILRIAIAVGVGYFLGPQSLSMFGEAIFGSTLGQALLGAQNITTVFMSGALSGIVVSSINSVMGGGSLADGFKAGLRGAFISGASAIFANAIGTTFDGKLGSATESLGTQIFGDAAPVAKVVAHGVAQGAVSRMQGAKFIQGFASGAAGSLGGGGAGPQGIAQAALLGGAASALAGGKFADGAMQGAFVHLYNDMMHHNLSKDLTDTVFEVRKDEQWDAWMLHGRRASIYARHAEGWGFWSDLFGATSDSLDFWRDNQQGKIGPYKPKLGANLNSVLRVNRASVLSFGSQIGSNFAGGFEKMYEELATFESNKAMMMHQERYDRIGVLERQLNQ